MPFTPTHTLAVIPIWSWCPGAYSRSALVIGCMIPDLPVLLPINVSYTTTHSLPGVVVACVPLGIVMLCCCFTCT